MLNGQRHICDAGDREGFAVVQGFELCEFFGVFLDPRAYTSLFFMLLSLATGIIYFTLTVTGLSLSAGLAVLIIGLPFFLVFVALTRVVSLAEGRLIEAMTGERMPRRPVHQARGDSLHQCHLPAQWPGAVRDNPEFIGTAPFDADNCVDVLFNLAAEVP